MPKGSQASAAHRPMEGQLRASRDVASPKTSVPSISRSPYLRHIVPSAAADDEQHMFKRVR